MYINKNDISKQSLDAFLLNRQSILKMLTNKIDKETRFPLLVVIKKFAVLFLIIADFRDSTLHRTTLNSILLVASL